MDIKTRLNGILYMMEKVQVELSYLTARCDDIRGNLDESIELAKDIRMNVSSYLKEEVGE